MFLRTALAAGAAALTLASAASAHTGVTDLSKLPGVNLPLVQSPNVRTLATFPETTAISGEFSHTGEFFYVSSLDSISVFDVSDPALPVLKGTIGDLVFENEAMAAGERRNAEGKLERFVLVGVDIYNASVDTVNGVMRGSTNGRELLVVDVTNPAAPYVRGRTPLSGDNRITQSTHTVQCLTVSCETVYTSGSSTRFGIVDLTDLSKPKQVKDAQLPVAGGHYWDIDETGIAWGTGGRGASALDVSDPLNPVPLASTNGQGRAGSTGGYNDFILHNSQRPNASRFEPGQPLSTENGNVLLVTEEDYVDTDCATAGSFQTWGIEQLDGTLGQIKPLDKVEIADLGGGLSLPQGAFCSSHWFDFHESGIVAVGFYQGGLRLLDVRDPSDIKQHGYMTGGASQVWDAYWVPERDAMGNRTGRKTNIVYTADAVRGLDVLEVDLPAAAKKVKKTKGDRRR